MSAVDTYGIEHRPDCEQPEPIVRPTADLDRNLAKCPRCGAQQIEGKRTRFIVAPGLEREFTAFVGSDEVRVRFRRAVKAGAIQWRCDEHGAHKFTTCDHEKTAATAWRALKGVEAK